MKSDLLKKVENFTKQRINAILFLSIATFFLQIPSFYGEDIVNARNNYLIGNRTDFWGGVSTVVYSFIPDLGFRWQIWLAILQIALTSLALQKLLVMKNQNRINYLIKLVVAYSALVFGSQMTRDGLMFSLLIFGYAALDSALRNQGSLRVLILPLLIICIAMSFRPWLSIAIIPILLIPFWRSNLKISRWTIAAITVLIAVAPLAIEFAAAKSLKLKQSFPEQQVMLMDSAATYCYTTNTETGMKAKEALLLFTSDPSYPRFACQLYRPDTWLSLTKAINTSSAGYEVEFSLIQPGDSERYEALRSSWMKMIVNDPVTYIQNKMLFASKLLIGSDSRYISILSADSNATKILGIFRIFYDVAITIHIYSFLALILILFFLPLSRYLKRKENGLIIDRVSINMIVAIVLWTSLSAIAYIGSNGRYTYALTILSLVIYVSYVSEVKAHRKRNG
jgi:hypothetical protein